jgi:type IV pilus assembly protein PilM
MLTFLAQLFKKSEDNIIGIDIGPSSIKVVQLRKRRGRASLVTYGALALGPYAGTEAGRATHLPPEKIAEALIDLLRESGVTTKKGGLSIAMSSSLLTVIDVPAVSEKQLAQIVPIEARKYIPIPISEVSLDFLPIPKEQTGVNAFQTQPGETPVAGERERMQVLLVVIHNDAIASARQIVKLSGVDASFFEIEIFSAIRALFEHEPNPVLIIDFGAGSTKLYIVDRGILRSSHIITRGSQDLTLSIAKAMNFSIDEAEHYKREKGLVGDPQGAEVLASTINYIFSETNRVILNYQKKYNKNISKVVLTGGGASLKGLREMAAQELAMPVENANPFAKVEAPAALAPILAESGPEFTVAVGLALRGLQDII